MNILILSCGRRVELIQAFRKSLNELKLEGKVFGADCSEHAPALYESDGRILLPRVDQQNYLESLIQSIIYNKIEMVVPTIDTELGILSKNKSYIEKTTDSIILVSSKKVISMCSNKKNTAKFFNSIGKNTPHVYDNLNEISKYPVYIKPMDGSSSIDNFIVNNEKELDFFYNYIANPIVQEYIIGEEYTVDVCLNFDSTPVSIVPRIRLATRSGEILKGKIINDTEIIAEVKQILPHLQAIGHITIQLFKTKNSLYFLEINPRFGGGAPISIFAGADSPTYLIEMVDKNKHISFKHNIAKELTALRYDQAVYLNPEGDLL